MTSSRGTPVGPVPSTRGTPVGPVASSRGTPVGAVPRDPPTGLVHVADPSSPRRSGLLGVAMVLLLLGLPLWVLAAQAPTRSAARSQEQHAAQLSELESDLAAGNSTAVAALLARLEPELDKDERFALDVAYRLIKHRLFSEAAGQWNRAAKKVQASMQASSGQTLSPAADRGLQRRFAEVVFVQGLLTARLGEKAEALRLLRQADGYGFPPLDSPLMAFAAECLYELKEYALAAQAYQDIVKTAPQNAEARLRLGVSLYSSGQLVPAEKELEQALRQAPSLPHAHYTLGAVLFEQKRVEEARTHFEQELASDPRCTGCMAKLAHIAYLKGDDRQCESWLAKAAAVDPGDVETNLVHGMLANRSGHYDQAIVHLTKVVEASPGYAKAQYQLAIAYQRSGNAEKAREHQEIYDKLIQEEKARTIGVRGE
jgi:tetratricopeptide (TPR) repeat protein